MLNMVVQAGLEQLGEMKFGGGRACSFLWFPLQDLTGHLEGRCPNPAWGIRAGAAGEGGSPSVTSHVDPWKVISLRLTLQG